MFVLALSLYNTWNRGVFLLCKITNLLIYSYIDKLAENLHFDGFLLHTLKTMDKVLRYGENNQVDFFEHPMVIQCGDVRTINIYAAVSNVA